MNEADTVSVCPKCRADMFIDSDGKRMVCPNTACSFLGYDLPQRMPSYSEALQQLNEIKVVLKTFMSPINKLTKIQSIVKGDETT